MSRRSVAVLVTILAACALVTSGAGAAAAAPANDNFADAQVVGPSLPVSIATDNLDATGEVGEPSHYSVNPPQSSVWFRWTAPSASKVTLSSCEPSLFFGQVAVYTGSSVEALTPVIQAGSCIARFVPVPGTTYSIAVEGNSTRQAFVFSLSQFSPPTNDNFANSLAVGPTLPVAQPATNVDSTIEPSEPAGHGSTFDGRSVWFSWTAPETTTVRLDVCEFDAVSGPSNAGIWVYTGATLGSLVPVANDFDGCRLSFKVTNGISYRIAFSATISGEGNFTLKLLKETPPANDNFATALDVSTGLPISIAGSTVFSTVETGEPHHGNSDEGSFAPNDSVWLSWTPSATTQARIRVCDADFNARLGVYTGNAVNALTRVTPTVPILSFPFCSIRFEATQGTTYRIAIGGSGSEEEGEFELDVHTFGPPANDHFGSAQVIGPGLPISIGGSNLDSSAEPGEPGHEQYDDDQPYTSVWYSWTPSASATARISTCGSEFRSSLAIYTGTAVDELSEVAAGKGGCGSAHGHQIDFAAIAGTRYLIAVDGGRDEEGSFALRLTSIGAATPIPPALTPIAEKKSTFSLRKALKKCRKIERRKPRRKCIKRARRRAKQERRQA